MRRLLAKLALSLASLALLALSAEIYLRCFRPERFLEPPDVALRAEGRWSGLVHARSRLPGLPYELAPDLDCEARGMRIRTNSLRMRDDEPLPRDTPGLVRIAVIGDSMAFGFGVQQGEDFPARLEALLNERENGGPRRFEVLNFAVCGYSVRDELATLREKALPLAPDLVIVAYCLNDPDVGVVQPLQAYFRPVEWWRHSHLARYFACKLHVARMRRFGDGNLWRAMHNPEGPFRPVAARELDRMRDACAERGVPVLFAVLPHLVPRVPWPEYGYRDVHAHLSREALARGFEAVDLAVELEAHEPRALTLDNGDMHFSAFGNAEVARALADRIEALLARGAARCLAAPR